MKNPLGYLLLIFTALMLLTVIGGISMWFESISATWTVSQTDIVARNFAQVFWYGGIVFVSVTGYYLYTLAPKPIQRSRPAQTGRYMIEDASMGVPEFKALPAPTEEANWYELDKMEEMHA